MKRNLIFACIIMLFTCFSCQKDIEEVAPTQSTNLPEKIKFEEGMLVFNDSTEFQEMVSLLCANNIFFKSSNFDQKPDGFISMMDVYQQAKNFSDEKQNIKFCETHPAVFCKVGSDTSFFFELKIPFVLSLITNENGMLKVGDKYVLYSNDYIYKSNSLQSLMAIVHSNFDQTPMEVVIQKTNSNIGIDEKDNGQYSYKTAYFSTKHRIVARLYKYQGDYSRYYYDARTTAQKSILGAWVQEDIDQVKIYRSSGYAESEDAQDWVYITACTGYNSGSDLMMNVAWLLYSYANTATSYCTTIHYGTRDGSTISITNSDIF